MQISVGVGRAIVQNVLLAGIVLQQLLVDPLLVPKLLQLGLPLHGICALEGQRGRERDCSVSPTGYLATQVGYVLQCKTSALPSPPLSIPRGNATTAVYKPVSWTFPTAVADRQPRYSGYCWRVDPRSSTTCSVGAHVRAKHMFFGMFHMVPNVDPPGRRQDTREAFHAIIRWIRRLEPQAAGQALPQQRSTLNGLVSEPRLLTPLTCSNPVCGRITVCL